MMKSQLESEINVFESHRTTIPTQTRVRSINSSSTQTEKTKSPLFKNQEKSTQTVFSLKIAKNVQTVEQTTTSATPTPGGEKSITGPGQLDNEEEARNEDDTGYEPRQDLDPTKSDQVKKPTNLRIGNTKQLETDILADSPIIMEDMLVSTPSIMMNEESVGGLFDRISMGETKLDESINSTRSISMIFDDDEFDIDEEGEGEVEEGWMIKLPGTDPTINEGEKNTMNTAGSRKSVILDLEAKKQKRIDYILREMRTTEETYVADLNRVFDRFIDPLKRKKGIFKKENLKVFSMFAKLQIIRNINIVFLTDLEKVISLETSNADHLDKISNTIYKFSQTFKLYSDYVSNFNDLNVLITDMFKTNKKFLSFCEGVQRELASEGARITDLQSFLITPIQRIPRLNLMMRDLVKIVGTDFKEHVDLSKAKTIIGDMGKYCNDKTREHKNLKRIEELGRELRIPDLVQPHRKLICEKVVDRVRKSGKPLESKVLVFSDLLVIYPLKRPIDLTFTFFKEPYVVDLTSPLLKLKLIDETTVNIDYYKGNSILKNIMLSLDSEKEGIEMYSLLQKQVMKKRVKV